MLFKGELDGAMFLPCFGACGAAKRHKQKLSLQKSALASPVCSPKWSQPFGLLLSRKTELAVTFSWDTTSAICPANGSKNSLTLGLGCQLGELGAPTAKWGRGVLRVETEWVSQALVLKGICHYRISFAGGLSKWKLHFESLTKDKHALSSIGNDEGAAAPNILYTSPPGTRVCLLGTHNEGFPLHDRLHHELPSLV